jgi:hypothetical protein
MRHAISRVGALSSVPLLLARRVTLPTATTGTATSVTATTATLNGTVSANGSSTTVEFEYGTSSGSYTSTATAAQSPVTGDSVAVSAAVSGLGIGTYYFRVKATNTVGTTYGAEQSVAITAADAGSLAYLLDYRYVQTSGSDVLQMDDQSGNANHATSSAGSRPTLAADGVAFTNGQHVVAPWSSIFSSTTDDFTIFCVLKYTADDVLSTVYRVSNGGAAANDNLTTAVIGYTADNTGFYRVNTESFIATNIADEFGTTAYRVSTIQKNGTVARVFRDGVQRGSDETTTSTLEGNVPTASFDMYIGKNGNFAVADFEGRIAAFLVYNEALSATNRQAVETWLTNTFV